MALEELDLTPRTTEPASPRAKRHPAAWVFLALLVVAIAFVLFQFLNNAAVYYKNADEAVRDKQSLGTKRLRVQGVVQEPVTTDGQTVVFDILFNGATVPVRHTGAEPPDLFKPGIPVVLEGHWDTSGDFYASDAIQIKHSSEYKEKNPDRVASDAP